MRAVSLHRDVIVVTSALLTLNCVIVRGDVGERRGDVGERVEGVGERRGDTAQRLGDVGGSAEGEPPQAALGANAETFVIDSPLLPDELDALPSLIEQAGFPAPSGLLATHGDWDHLLGRLAFPTAALGCAESTAERLTASPGEAQRELRAFDEELMIERPHPLALGSVQALPVPGRCAVGDRELELHAATGHTADGMAVLVPWAGVLIAGDYLSVREIPTLGYGGGLESYLLTLEHMRELLTRVEHVVPGHGPVIDVERTLQILEEDIAYLHALRADGRSAPLPAGRGSREQRRLHARNVAAL